MGDRSARAPRRIAPVPRLLGWLGRSAVCVAAKLGSFARTRGGPWVLRAGLWGMHRGRVGGHRVARSAWARRRIGTGLLARAGWWLSLWFAVQGALALLGVTPLGTRQEILAPFVACTVLAAAVSALCGERHLRWGGALLGAMGAGLWVLAWTALSPPGA